MVYMVTNQPCAELGILGVEIPMAINKAWNKKRDNLNIEGEERPASRAREN
jgi:hypothetical protein